MRKRSAFSHERLKVYQSSAEFVELARCLVANLPPGNAHLSDQLRRASVSVCLNIAEGAGEYRRKEKARLYRIAKRSATECAAIVDLIGRMKADSGDGLSEAREQLLDIVSMLTGLAKSLDE